VSVCEPMTTGGPEVRPGSRPTMLPAGSTWTSIPASAIRCRTQSREARYGSLKTCLVYPGAPGSVIPANSCRSLQNRSESGASDSILLLIVVRYSTSA
jgi:hypothetical protein